MATTKKGPGLTREEKAVMSLGRAAEWFIEEDRKARGLRSDRNTFGQIVASIHYAEAPCFGVEKYKEEDEVWSKVWTERKPLEEWCGDCRKYAEAADAAAMAYWDRRRARSAMTAAYRRLIKSRESTGADEGKVPS